MPIPRYGVLKGPILDRLPALQEEFTPIPSQRGGLALDYIRDTLSSAST